jgi:hypothetical protein
MLAASALASADERTAAFRHRIVFKGYVYYCKR